MPNKHISQSILPPPLDAVEAVDVGEISNAYVNDAERQAVHEVYERGNEVAAEKNEPLFDNRTGFATVPKPAVDKARSADKVLSAEAVPPSGESLGDDLNNPSATAPVIPASGLQGSDAADRKNDSAVAPEKSKTEALRGFHGG